MLGLLSPFIQDFFGANAAAVGVDLGTETLRLAQVRAEGEAYELTAAAVQDVPPGTAEEPVAYAEFCAEALKELWREGQFEGRKAVLGVPSTMMHLLHLRLPKLDSGTIQAALAFEAAGKLPFDPVAGILRHHVVGDVYSNDGPRQEVICTAVRRDCVELLLNAAEKARLEVAGLVGTPMALRDCFSRLYRRSSDAETAYCIIDIGRTGTRVTIMRSGHLYFARTIPIGGEHLNNAVANALGVRPAEAKLLRAQLAEQQNASDEQAIEGVRSVAAGVPDELAMPGSGTRHAEARIPQRPRGADPEAYVMTAARSAAPSSRGGSSLMTDMSVAHAIEPLLHQLADELQRCRRYHEGTFPNVPVDRLVFVGGEAHSRSLCQSLARRLSIAAQIGDSIAALTQDIPTRQSASNLAAAGIDRRRPQPGWAVACGLSMGAPA